MYFYLTTKPLDSMFEDQFYKGARILLLKAFTLEHLRAKFPFTTLGRSFALRYLHITKQKKAVLQLPYAL